MHAGHIIYAYLKANGIQVTDFARRLPCKREHAYDIFRRPNIGAEQIRRISDVLGHNFFADLAEAYDAERGTNAAPSGPTPAAGG